MGVTVKGKQALACRLGGLSDVTYPAMKYLAYGSDTATAFAKAQNALVGTEHDRQLATVAAATTTDTNDTCQISYSFSVASAVTSGEIGVFDAGAAGNMGARTLLSSSKTLSAGSTYAVVYKIIVSA